MKKLILLSMLFNQLAFAESAEEKGLRIAQEIEKRNEGFVGESSKMEMVLVDAYGAKTVRLMDGKIKEIIGDGDKSLSVFLNPQDVKGTKMLTHSHKSDDDDQWLYLPSLRRVKRISSSSKSASFMGSEFSYEDLGSQEVEKYNYVFIKDETVGGDKTWVLERTPKKSSGYSKMKLWVSQTYYNPIKIEYYDRKNELLKVAEFKDFKIYNVKNKKLYRASSIHMKNIQTKKESVITWSDRKLGVSFSDKDFAQERLK
ncbi:MAG: outer membrane lipoprotein-sorting protein [Bdellovibrio sp.]